MDTDRNAGIRLSGLSDGETTVPEKFSNRKRRRIEGENVNRNEQIMVAHKEALPEGTIKIERKRNADNLKQFQNLRGKGRKMPSASKTTLKKNKQASNKERVQGYWRNGSDIKH